MLQGRESSGLGPPAHDALLRRVAARHRHPGPHVQVADRQPATAPRVCRCCWSPTRSRRRIATTMRPTLRSGRSSAPEIPARMSPRAILRRHPSCRRSKGLRRAPPCRRTLTRPARSIGACITTSGWSTDVQYLTDAGSAGTAAQQPMLLEQQTPAQNGPEDDTGPVQLRGPKRDELWVTPDTRASIVAPYLVAWRAKVERIGTLNFPAAARHAGRNASTRDRGRDRRGWTSRAGGDPALERRSGARPGGAHDSAAGQPLRPIPAGTRAALPRPSFVYEWQFTGGRLATGSVSAAP